MISKYHDGKRPYKSMAYLTPYIVQMRKTGMTYQAIADELECSVSVAHRYANPDFKDNHNE